MKRAVFTHPKLYDLAARLNCERPCAIGYLSLLWDFAACHSPRGDIGRWADGAITRACDWRGDTQTFITALIASGWLDVHREHRLVIHDWESHCEKWVALKLQKNKQSFININLGTTAEAIAEATAEAIAEATAEAIAEATAEATVEATTEASSPSPSPSPIPKNIDIGRPEEPSGPSTDSAEPPKPKSRFAEFWIAYPKKVKRRPSEAKWKARRLDDLADRILSDIRERLKRDRRWLDGFVPDPLTYINQNRWEDEIDGGNTRAGEKRRAMFEGAV